jgi:hypothetical protein
MDGGVATGTVDVTDFEAAGLDIVYFLLKNKMTQNKRVKKDL